MARKNLGVSVSVFVSMYDCGNWNESFVVGILCWIPPEVLPGSLFHITDGGFGSSCELGKLICFAMFITFDRVQKNKHDFILLTSAEIDKEGVLLNATF